MWTVLLAVLLNGNTLHARPSDKYSYPMQRISLKGVRDLKIVGVKGTLKLTGANQRRTRSLAIKVQHSRGRRYEDWHLSVDRRGRTLFLEVFHTSYGNKWKNHIREELWPEFDIELSAPKIPVNVAWREGRIDLSQFHGDVDLSLLKGDIRIRGGAGRVNLQPVQANVEVTAHNGSLNIRGESGSLRLAQLTGDIAINWVRGKISLTDCRGNVQVESQSGYAVVTGLRGTLQAKGETTKWDLSAAAPADVNVTTVTGPVDVSWKSGGAKVFLSSNQGKIHYPPHNFLKATESDGGRVVQGVRSAKSMGQVFVRTQAGPITWRQ